MALDLSPERFGSKAPSEGSYMSGKEIMAKQTDLNKSEKMPKLLLKKS